MNAIGRVIRSTITIAALLECGTARSQDVGRPPQGFRLAQQVCAECHAIDKATMTSPNPTAPRFQTIANTPGMSEMALSVALRTPHRTMPNLILESDEVRDVAAYILSL